MFLKPISLRTLFSLTSSSSPSPLSIFITQLSTSSPSHLTYSHSQSHPDSRNVRVLVWWDFENCNVPTGVNVMRVRQAITAAVRSNGIKGPIQITAFGDMLQLARTNQEGLSSIGIKMNHVPHGGKNSADRSLIIDLMCWVSQNPPPAHLFLISSDGDFSSILHRLRMQNYNILLASKESVPPVLSSAASIMWNWDALLRGENLTGRYFNHPPDGPFGSWYGYYKGPFEDPFLVVERPTCSRGGDLTEVSSDPPVRPIPKAVRKQISNILTSKANGISIGDLRQELLKSNVVIDKDLYGYKKFSRFLLAMPHILKLKAIGDGQFLVQGKPVTNNGSHCITKSSTTNGENISPSGSACGVSSRPPSPRLNVEESQKIVQQPLEKPEQLPLGEKAVKMHREQPLEKLEQLPIGEKAVKMNREQPPNKIELPPLLGEKTIEAVEAHATENRTLPLPESDLGFSEKLRRLWFGSDYYSEIKKDIVPKESYSSGDSCEKRSENTMEKCDPSLSKDVEKKCVKSQIQTDDPPLVKSCSKSTVASSVEHNSTSEGGTFENLRRLWFGSDNCSRIKNDVTLKESFTSRDSCVKKSEVTMGKYVSGDNCQNVDPLDMKSCSNYTTITMSSEPDGEKPSKRPAFFNWIMNWCKLRRNDAKSVASDVQPSEVLQQTHSKSNTHEVAAFSPIGSCSSGLRSIFLSSQSDTQKLAECLTEKKSQASSDSGCSPAATNKSPSEKFRTEILGDCQTLVNEVLKESPRGYSLTSFRKLFLQRFGYNIDVKKLGYQNLSSLLQIMPGVKVESNFLIPSVEAGKHFKKDGSLTSANSDSELSDASKRDDESDSPWEELGPVEDSGSHRKELQSALRKKVQQEAKKCTYPDYESAFSDDDISGSEEENSPETKQEGQMKPGKDDEDSSLLQILDSWYSSKDGSENAKRKAKASESKVGCADNDFGLSDSSELLSKIETSLRTIGRKQKPQKTYSFVDSSAGHAKGKLVDDIIGSLKKSTEPSGHG